MTPDMKPARGDDSPGAASRDQAAGQTHGERTAVVLDFEAAAWRRAARLAWAHLCRAGLANPISYGVLFGDERWSA